jgi:predicted nucleic acid-binding protein
MLTMTVKLAFDTNILVYMVSADFAKASISTALVRAGGIVSVQVLNEFTSVMKRKFLADWVMIDVHLMAVRSTCSVIPVTLEVHERGRRYAERYQLQVHDGMIVAAAVLAGCTTLYTEDMHHGLAIEGLTIQDPFRV